MTDDADAADIDVSAQGPRGIAIQPRKLVGQIHDVVGAFEERPRISPPVGRAVVRCRTWMRKLDEHESLADDFRGERCDGLRPAASTPVSAIVRGAPGRGSSSRPSSRFRKNRVRHLPTVGRVTRSWRAITPFDAPSAPCTTIPPPPPPPRPLPPPP